MRVFRTLVLSSRPLSWVNTAIPFGLGYFLVKEEFTLPMAAGMAFFLIPYNFLMYGINDVFDYESDLRNPRKGGVEGALLPPALHRTTLWASALLSAPFVFFLVTQGTGQANLVLGLTLFFVIAYSVKGLRFKEKPFLDSMTSSLHFVLPAVYGLFLAQGTLSPLAITLFAAFFTWGMASHAFGAVQDVIADREAGLGSIATAIGAAGAVRFALALYVLAGLVMLSAPGPLALIAPAALLYIAAVIPWWRVKDSAAEAANKGWRWFLLLNFVTGAVIFLVLFEWWALRG